MLHNFDYHVQANMLALLRSGLMRSNWIELGDLRGEIVGKVGSEFLPLVPRWSPDGSRIAFGSNDGLIYLYSLGDAVPEILIGIEDLEAGFPEWSPDGTRLVFSAYDRETHAPPNIYCLELATGEVKQLTASDDEVDRFPFWSPSGEWIAFRRQHLGDPERRLRVCLLEVASGRCLQVPAVPGAQCRMGRLGWSPDSAHVLVTKELSNSVCLQALRLKDMTADWSHSAPTIHGGAFSPSGGLVLCVCTDELLWFSFPAGQLVERLTLPPTAAVKEYSTGPEVCFGNEDDVLFLGTDSCLYRWKSGDACSVALREEPEQKPHFTLEEYAVSSLDRRSVPVQRFTPTCPSSVAIQYVHGGPGGPIDPDDPFMLRLLAEKVEFVCAAYRGSAGYGDEHKEANRGEYGRADVWDVLACGREWRQRTQGRRPLVLVGYSYGGFLALLALAQPEAPWAGGIAMWTVSGLHRLPAHAHRAFLDDSYERAVAMVERSPLEQAGHIQAPPLIFHGARDTVATTEELRQIQQRIHAAGGTCDLVIFEDDTHSLMRHRDDIHAMTLQFLGRIEQACGSVP